MAKISPLQARSRVKPSAAGSLNQDVTVDKGADVKTAVAGADDYLNRSSSKPFGHDPVKHHLQKNESPIPMGRAGFQAMMKPAHDARTVPTRRHHPKQTEGELSVSKVPWMTVIPKGEGLEPRPGRFRAELHHQSGSPASLRQTAANRSRTINRPIDNMRKATAEPHRPANDASSKAPTGFWGAIGQAVQHLAKDVVHRVTAAVTGLVTTVGAAWSGLKARVKTLVAPSSAVVSRPVPSSPKLERAMYELLLDLFGVDELRREVRHQFGRDLTMNLPGPSSSAASVADSVVSATLRRGLVDDTFFDWLRRLRPHQEARIQHVERIYRNLVRA